METAKPPTAPEWLYHGFLVVTCPIAALTMISVAVWPATDLLPRLVFVGMGMALGALGWSSFQNLQRR